jgi:Holliday junction resolvase-like predicted endonuclease
MVTIMTSQSTGSLHEREATKLYEDRGWSVFRPQKTARFGQQDIWGMWDLCAINGDQLHFVQIKTKTTRGFLKRLEAWRKAHPVQGVTWVLMVRQDARKKKEKWRIYK